MSSGDEQLSERLLGLIEQGVTASIEATERVAPGQQFVPFMLTLKDEQVSEGIISAASAAEAVEEGRQAIREDSRKVDAYVLCYTVSGRAPDGKTLFAFMFEAGEQSIPVSFFVQLQYRRDENGAVDVSPRFLQIVNVGEPLL